jgi:hypothetical protein
MHEVDPGYFGYWSKEEVAVFLTTLLERERIGTRAFADIGHAADLRIADLILESELDQGSICVLLQQYCNFIGRKSSNSRSFSSRGLRCCASFRLPAVA